MNWSGTIPIYINNRDRLTTTRELAHWFDDVPGVEVIIIDNASTYPPLLEWYERYCPYRLIRLPENSGHHAPWQQGCILWGATHRAMFGSEFYCVTDPDLRLDGIPKDLIEVFVEGLAINKHLVKVGVSLEIDDLPECTRDKVRHWEAKFWSDPLSEKFFRAAIDTTLAIYRTEHVHALVTRTDVPCLRTNRPYTARHVPWYIDPTAVSEEEQYYFDHAGRWTNWRPQ